jgi:hypothetical protein
MHMLVINFCKHCAINQVEAMSGKDAHMHIHTLVIDFRECRLPSNEVGANRSSQALNRRT